MTHTQTAVERRGRGIGRKIWVVSKIVQANSRGCGGHSSPDAEGYIPFLYYFRGIFY